jgi:hypothetical protein
MDSPTGGKEVSAFYSVFRRRGIGSLWTDGDFVYDMNLYIDYIVHLI